MLAARRSNVNVQAELTKNMIEAMLKSFDNLATPEGKEALKKTIAERAAKVLHHKVSDVLFSDFVIQF